jgi:hypothetical protein
MVFFSKSRVIQGIKGKKYLEGVNSGGIRDQTLTPPKFTRNRLPKLGGVRV